MLGERSHGGFDSWLNRTVTRSEKCPSQLILKVLLQLTANQLICSPQLFCRIRLHIGRLSFDRARCIVSVLVTSHNPSDGKLSEHALSRLSWLSEVSRLIGPSFGFGSVA